MRAAMQGTTVVMSALALSGCTLSVASSNPRQVVIEHPGGRADNQAAQRLADAECSKHRRIAKMTAWPMGINRTWVFDCVD